MSRKFSTSLLALAVVLSLAVVMVLVLFRGQPPPRAPLPIPNGFDNFIKASELLPSSEGSFADLDHDSLRALVSTNAESLRLLRTGLTRPSAITMDFPMTNIYLNQYADIKRIVQIVAAEGRLHEMDDQPAQAAQSYVDAIRFGNEISRNRVVLPLILSRALEMLGYQSLVMVVPKIKTEDLRIVIGDLEKIDAGRITRKEILENERYYKRYQMRNRHNPLLNPSLWITDWRQSRQNLEKVETRNKIVVAHERLFLGELALLRYRSEMGHPPARLDEVVPGYLSKVPQDPFTGNSMVYRSQGTNWLIYSVGPDGVDDGGRPAVMVWPVKGDLPFDLSW